jgi:hypothetical protein
VFSALSPADQDTVQKFLPDTMRNSLTAVKPVANLLSPGVTLFVLFVYAMVTLAAGAWALARRDA